MTLWLGHVIAFVKILGTQFWIWVEIWGLHKYRCRTWLGLLWIYNWYLKYRVIFSTLHQEPGCSENILRLLKAQRASMWLTESKLLLGKKYSQNALPLRQAGLTGCLEEFFLNVKLLSIKLVVIKIPLMKQICATRTSGRYAPLVLVPVPLSV